MRATWTIGGDFIVYDDDDSPIVQLKLQEPLRSHVIDLEGRVELANAISDALKTTPHPYDNALHDR
jgi:hypothetical protein